MAHILLYGIHVFLMEKLTKILESEDHIVIGVFSIDMVRYNLRSRNFDFVIVANGVRDDDEVQKAVNDYQQSCKIIDAVFERDQILESLS